MEQDAPPVWRRVLVPAEIGLDRVHELVTPGDRLEYTYDLGDCWDHEILTDPGHDEHRFMLDWLGLGSQDQFDPVRFDPDDANRRLAAESHAGFISRR